MSDKPVHGGSPASDSAIDFSSNLHPSPAPGFVVDAAAEGLKEADRYPSPDAAPLRDFLSDRMGISQKQIVAGPGSSQILYQILDALRPRTVVLPTPCFSEYPYASSLFGSAVVEHPVSRQMEEFGDIGHPPKLSPNACVIFSNPGNPTGRVTSHERLLEWLAAVRAVNGWMILDEAYADFRADGSPDYDSSFFEAHPLILLRSPLKFFTLPGLRSGYAILPGPISDEISRRIPPWPLSQPAMRATLAALSADSEVVHRRRLQIRTWAEQFRKTTSQINSLMVFPSDVHFFLVRVARAGLDGAGLAGLLAAEGFCIRTSAGIPGLTPNDVRLSTRFPEENGKLILALKKILTGAPAAAR